MSSYVWQRKCPWLLYKGWTGTVQLLFLLLGSKYAFLKLLVANQRGLEFHSLWLVTELISVQCIYVTFLVGYSLLLSIDVPIIHPVTQDKGLVWGNEALESLQFSLLISPITSSNSPSGLDRIFQFWHTIGLIHFQNFFYIDKKIASFEQLYVKYTLSKSNFLHNCSSLIFYKTSTQTFQVP